MRDIYPGIAGPGQAAVVGYRSRIPTEGLATAEIRDRLLDLLESMGDDEIRRGTTLAGPHRDDLEFFLNGKPLNHHGSQGEQRSFVLALKIAEIEHLKKKWGNPPVLLLDDMTSELDRDRNGNFMSFLKEQEMQVFITTTSLDNISLGGMEYYSTFPVSNGKVLTEV
jgi:DNA replication and repair protein RecF